MPLRSAPPPSWASKRGTRNRLLEGLRRSGRCSDTGLKVRFPPMPEGRFTGSRPNEAATGKATRASDRRPSPPRHLLPHPLLLLRKLRRERLAEVGGLEERADLDL